MAQNGHKLLVSALQKVRDGSAGSGKVLQAGAAQLVQRCLTHGKQSFAGF